MKKYIKKIKEFKRKVIVSIAQSYADVIIIQLKISDNEMRFNYWINQGLMLDSYMIMNHDIYLD